jgi:hypothetical protein
MSQTSWFAEKTTTVGLVAGFFGGKKMKEKKKYEFDDGIF